MNIHIPNKINRVTAIGDMQPRKFPPADPLASVESFAVAMDAKNLCLVNGGGGGMRGIHLLPKRGDKREWQHTQDYWAEKDEFPLIDLDGEEFVYG